MANIQDLRAKNTPQFSYMFEVDITGQNFASNDISVLAKTVSIPQSSVEQMIINHKAGKSHYASKDSAPHTVNIVFWDDEAATVQRFFDSWMTTVQDPDTMNGISRSNYTADINIRLKDVTDQTETASIKLTGCWLMEVSDISLSYDSTEALEVSVSLSYETKKVTYNN